MTCAICVATCTYCGITWRPIVEADANHGVICELECPSCGGAKTGHVRVITGFEDTIEAALARAEALVEEEH